MHLRTLRIRGFKSFPEPLEITLEPGVAVVVGPNGSGKSNIADAVVWAAGSLTPSELRAEKPDDVLFAGGGDRKPSDHCEVELVFDNEDDAWPELDFSEVSIARRLVRGAEGQYLVNRAPVRRTDALLTRYCPSAPRTSRRAIETSLKSSFGHVSSSLSKTSSTSQ